MYLLKFGAYTFPATYYPAGREFVNVVALAKATRYYGASVLRGSQDAIRLTVHGGLIKGPISTPSITTIRDERDTMLYNLLTGGMSDLYFGEDDRYYHNAQVERFPDTYGPRGYGRIVENEIAFVCGDPRQHSTTLSTDSWSPASSGATHVVTVGGTTAAEPVISITVPGLGSVTIAWTLANATRGESVTLAGTVNGGEVIVMDTYAKTVVIGSDDRMDLVDGGFIIFNPGSSTLQSTYTGAVAVGAISIQWRNRYL